jgi:uncharacterized protein YyaL (SSP411 family)
MSNNPPVSNPNLEGYNVVAQFWKRFWNPSKGSFTSPRPKCSGTYGDENKFNVWSVAVAVQAIVDGARIYPQELGPLIDPAIKALYRYKSDKFHGYCAVENFPGNNDIYYDDDAQVASALIAAYEVTQNKEYLDQGRELVRYLMGGWNNDKKAKIQGGILWHRDKPYISAISNAEVAHAVLQLAKFIPKERDYYIEFATKVIDWQLKYLRDEGDGLILDGIDKNSDGGKNGMKWTYNTGVTLSCCVLLYEFTKQEKWLKLSNELAAAATNRNKSLFCRDYNEFDRRYWRDPSYFIQLLFEGLSDYLLVIGDQAPKSTSSAIRGEFKRHLEYFRKYHYDPRDGLYFQMFEAHRISPEIWEIYRKQFGDSKKFDPNPEERAQEGGGELKDKPLVKTLIGSGAAARIWFHAARVLPEIQY